MERLKEEVAFTKTLNKLLEEIDTYKRAVPAPMKPYDSAISATAPLQMTDKGRMLALFEKLRDDLKDRVEKGIGIVDNEKLRLMWIGNPPIVDFNLLSYPEKHGVVIAKGLLELLTGFTLAPELIDPENPLESIARAHLYSPANPTHHGLLKYFIQTIKDYKIDGIISVVKRSCGHLPGSVRLSKDEVYEKTGVPTTIFNCEGSDGREYDPDEARANIDTFIETLLARNGD
jgi:benzoyl-CoA reductase/2-hydroxyglutaryl-CoA dehydratase subunit BcrC/BadD/HgdB